MGPDYSHTTRHKTSDGRDQEVARGALPSPMSRRRWTMLALVTLAHAGGSLAVLSVAPLTPFLLTAFHLSRAQVGLLVPAVYLGGVLMSLPAGWLTDRLGVRPTFSLGLTVTGIAMMMAAQAASVALFLV